MENVYKHTGCKDWENGLFYENINLLTNQFNDLLPVGLLAYADHDRYCRGQGFESLKSLNVFQAFFSQLQKLRM